MRYHFWQFLINQEGQPINEAFVSVYLAGTETPVVVYTGETTNSTASIAPQLTTSSNGYFEFWIGDEEEPIGYTRGTKIKIAWSRPGISSGMVDNIEVFQTLDGVDETDPDSMYKNKLISNALAYRFNAHSVHDVVDDGFPIHGLMNVDVASTNNVFNKVVSDRLAYEWENHKNYEFQEILSVETPGAPHDLQPVNPTLNDSKYNKIISNEILYNINSEFEGISNSFYTGSFYASGWTFESPNYYFNVMHNLDEEFPFVICWNMTTNKVFVPSSIEMVDDNNIKITHTSAIDTFVRISRL